MRWRWLANRSLSCCWIVGWPLDALDGDGVKMVASFDPITAYRFGDGGDDGDPKEIHRANGMN